MIRFRGSKSTLNTVKELDAFPKIPEKYVETSTRGGTISICTFLLISLLVFSEIKFYFNTSLKYQYKVDHDFNEKVWLNFDIVVATHCALVGADVLDVTGQSTVFTKEIQEESCIFALTPEEEVLRAMLAEEKYRLINDNDGNKLSEMAIKQGFNTAWFTQRKKNQIAAPDSCRFFGSIPVNKVSGNFHITSGKPVSIAGNHAHISFLLPNMVMNFSHRINHFSFGDKKAGFINPLDADEVVSPDEGVVYNYYINVVSTKIKSHRVTTDSFLYSVTEQARKLNHGAGSHGMPGVFFKYDFSPLSVTITEKGMPLHRFLVRLCGIIGGIFATSAVINGLLSLVLNRFKSNSNVDTVSNGEVTPSTNLLFDVSQPIAVD